MVQGAGGTKLLSVPFTTGRVPLLLMIPVGRNAGTVVVRVKVRVMRVERVFMKEVVSDSAAAVVTGKAVAGGSDWIVTVMVPRSSDDESTGREVTSGAVGDAADENFLIHRAIVFQQMDLRGGAAVFLHP